MEIIIEEISRGHKLINRHKFDLGHINIGRGYDNDIIISDPHVCSEHLQLQYNGEHWLISDKGSINGSFLEGNKNTVIQHIVRSGDVITLGKSQIRIIFPGHPVADSIAISPFENLINLTRHPAVLALNILIFGCIAGWIINLNNAQEVTLTQILVPTIGFTLGFALWPAAISLVSYLTKNDARFWTQVGIAFIFFNLMWLSDFFEKIVNFNASSNLSLSWAITIIPLALAFSLFWLNCYIGFHTTPRRRNAIAGGLVLLLFGGSFIVSMSKRPDFSPHPSFDTTLMSPSFLVAPSTSVNQFVTNSEQLFNETKKAALEDK